MKCQKGSRTLGTFRIPKEVRILVRNSIRAKSSAMKCQKGSRTLGTFRIPKEVRILVRNSIRAKSFCPELHGSA